MDHLSKDPNNRRGFEFSLYKIDINGNDKQKITTWVEYIYNYTQSFDIND